MVLYNLLLLILYPPLYLASRFHRRLRENFELRKSIPDFSAARSKTHFWFHAASAGEFEQARAVALELKRRHKNVFVSFSFFSDSAFRAKKNDSVPDLLFALPFDFAWRMRRLVAAMQPAALIIAKYDAWPNQVRAAVKAEVPVYLVSATLPAKSKRYRFPLKYLLRPTYAAMRTIFSVNADHANRLRTISPQNVVVSGDTRFDAIAARLSEDKSQEKKIAAIKKAVTGRTVLVAGSSYRESEEFIVQFIGSRHAVGNKRFAAIIAPHHVRAERIAELEKLSLEQGLKVSRLSSFRGEKFDILIIDTLGLLPHLYPLATIAYVGGGFKGSVHSVIEPVIAGVPVITGPAIANSAEALELAEAGLVSILAEPGATAFAALVENLCKNRPRLARELKSYFRQRVGVSGEIVHTVMDDLIRRSKGETWHTHQL